MHLDWSLDWALDLLLCGLYGISFLAWRHGLDEECVYVRIGWGINDAWLVWENGIRWLGGSTSSG